MLGCRKEAFGTTAAGEAVSLYRLSNHAGAYVELLDCGCAVKGIWVPNRAGVLQNVVRGFSSLEEYEAEARPGGALLLGPAENGADEVPFAEGMWNFVAAGENFVSFQKFHAGKEDFLDMSVRFMWVDYNRLVIDLSVVPGEDVSLSPSSGIPFRLSENDPSGELLRLFGCTPLTPESAGALSAGPLRFAEFRRMPGELSFLTEDAGIHPLAEWASPESGLSLSVYSTMPGLRIRRTAEPGTAVQFMPLLLDESGRVPPAKGGREILQRIIYAFDPFSG